MSGFQTFEPVPIVQIGQNRFRTSSNRLNRPKPVRNRFVDSIARTFEIRTILYGFQTSGSKSSGLTHVNCPDFRRYSKSGQFNNRRLFENAEIRTSGFRTSTVYVYVYLLYSALDRSTTAYPFKLTLSSLSCLSFEFCVNGRLFFYNIHSEISLTPMTLCATFITSVNNSLRL